MKKRTARFLSLLGIVSATLAPAGESDALAVIVNKQTTVLQTTSNELRGIFLGNKEKWPNGTKVTVVTLSLDHAETQEWLKQICGMTEQDYKKYFMQLSFEGKFVNTPHLLASAPQVRAAVAATPGAIGIVRMHDVDSTVNVLKLDGVAPGTPGYKLASK